MLLVVIVTNATSKKNAKDIFLKKYGIPDCDILAIRIGRADNYHGISSRALKKLINSGVDIRYVSFGATSAERNALNWTDRYVFSQEYIVEKNALDLAYRAADVFLHDRCDGETFGIAIAEAVMAETPVVTHISRKAQGQIETLDFSPEEAIKTLNFQPELIKIRDGVKELKGGFIVGVEDHESYARAIILSKQKNMQKAADLAMERYSIPQIIGSLYEAYCKVSSK